jgi:hypothetical protein
MLLELKLLSAIGDVIHIFISLFISVSNFLSLVHCSMVSGLAEKDQIYGNYNAAHNRDNFKPELDDSKFAGNFKALVLEIVIVCNTSVSYSTKDESKNQKCVWSLKLKHNVP